jgi:hypothetical protein
MRHLIFLVFGVFYFQFADAQSYENGLTYLKELHARYYHGPCPCYTFSQKNTHYKADTVSGHSEWHETIRFPDYFKIQFGEKEKGNFVIFQNDSVYNFKGHKLIKTRSDSSSLLLILGGMYYRSFDDVVARFKLAAYDLNKMCSAEWNSEKVWVIGTASVSENSNQIWLSKKDGRVLRIIEHMKPDEVMDMRFESSQKWCKGFTETKVSFRRNGKLEQVEEYYDMKECR